MAKVEWTDSTYDLAGTKLHVSRAGKGKPVLVLHHETGTLDHLPFYDLLAARYDVIVPHHPGYSRSARPEWMRSVRDIAAEVLVLARTGLSSRGILGCKGKPETSFLDVLDETVTSGKTAADNLLDLYHGAWKGDISRVFRDFSY